MRLHRQKIGLTQKEIAGKLGVSSNLVCNWEKGKYLAGNAFKSKSSELCKILEAPLEELRFSSIPKKNRLFYVYGLREALRIRGITQTQLSKDTGVHISTISRISAKKEEAHIEWIVKISEAISVPIVSFRGGYKFDISGITPVPQKAYLFGLKDTLKAMGIRYKELAYRMKVTHSCIRKIANADVKCSPDRLKEISRILDVSESVLIGDLTLNNRALPA